jgi:hypothetical protein
MTDAFGLVLTSWVDSRTFVRSMGTMSYDKISGPTRKALQVRDKGCRWPGCDRPAAWTAGHHFVHWSRGGPTDLSNLVLLCHRHHWMVREGGWQIVRVDGGELRAIPPTLDFYQRLAHGTATSTA